MGKLSTGGGGVFRGSSIWSGVMLTLLLTREVFPFLGEKPGADEATLCSPWLTNSLTELFSILDALPLESTMVFFNKVDAVGFLVLRSCPPLAFGTPGVASEALASF